MTNRALHIPRFAPSLLLAWTFWLAVAPNAAAQAQPSVQPKPRPRAAETVAATATPSPAPVPTPAPGASPAPGATVAPTATPLPTVAPSPEPTFSVTHGALDGLVLEAYRLARRPVSLQVRLPALGGLAATELAPVTVAGRATPISLRGQALSGQAQPATVALAFDPTRTGAKVWVDPVDGGTIDGQPGGRLVTLGVGGTLAFTFQAPVGRSDRFHVVVRLDNVDTVLPFLVPDPEELPAAVKASVNR